MSDSRVEATLALRRDGRPTVGRDRIRLLEAVDQHGSISKAARSVGLSYKAAWDALNAVNNLLPRPVIVSQAGGVHGGGAVVTEEGKALIMAFHLLEARLARIADTLTAKGAQGMLADPFAMLWSLEMKTSARNAFRCVVKEIKRGTVNTEIGLELSDGISLAAIITDDSVDTLGLAVGGLAIALVKSSFIILAPGHEPPLTSARNRLSGIIIGREDGAVNSEIILDLGGGKTLAAVVTHESADLLGLVVGTPACAMFKASHVILAVD